MKSIVFIAKLSLVLTLGATAGVRAADGSIDDACAGTEAWLASTMAASAGLLAPTEVLALGKPVASEQLDDQRGGFDVVQNDMQLSGSVANNSAVNVATGHNLITEGSFANSRGFPMVVQNSGSNVLIQNATIINLQLQ